MNNFEKMRIMSERNMDIKLAPLSSIASVTTQGAAGYVTFAVPAEVAIDLSLNQEKYVGGFILANREQFESVAEGSSGQ